MTREFINRIVTKLTKHDVDFVVTGSVSKYLLGQKISTMDIDFVVKTNERNLRRIDEMGLEYQINQGTISENLRKGKIVRIKLFPFNFDLLPKLDGISTLELFRNSVRIKFEDKIVRVIAEPDLKRNYQTFSKYESITGI